MIRYAAAEGARLVKERWWITGILAVSLAVPLAIAGSAWNARMWVDPLLKDAVESVETAVLLKDEVDAKEIDAWISQLADEHEGWRIVRVDSEELRARLARWFPSLGGLMSEDREIELPTLVEITVPPDGSVGFLESDPKVLAVGPGPTLQQQLRVATNRVCWLAGVVSLGLFAAAVLMVSVSVHLEVFRHAEEIAIMRLVGATETTVRSPFLAAALVPGALAAVLAVAVTTWITAELSASVAYFGLPPISVAPTVIAAEVLATLLLPLAAAAVTLHRSAVFEAPSATV